ncbi:cell division ATPase MinD [Haloferax volcanii]|uniref:cell division ATPase MinD n=1 Tax=Haloferax volcanii TaxID=2246 RepID=UPI0023D9C955|nr:cell division ATPase MinD [Haloferax lucentense]
MARVYAVASAKGGVGKTTSTANLGTTLAMAGHDVVVVDGDLGMPNLAGALGVDPDGATLHDVLMGEAAVETAVYDGPAGLSVLPGSNALEAFATANAKELEPVISTLEASYDIVIIDTGAGLSDDTFVPLKLADEVILVSTTEREALGDTEKTRQLADRIGADVVGVVLTRVDQSKPNADVVASLLDTGVIAVVPESPAIREALSTRDPVVVHSPDSIATAGYRALAEALTGTPVPVPGLDDEADEADEADEPADAADPEPDPEPAPDSDFVEDSGDGVDDGAGPAATPDLDSGSDSVADPDAAAVADEGRATADPELEPEAEPNAETEPEPAVDSDTDDDLAASIPFSASTVEEPDDPAEPDPADGADASESAADPAVDSAVDPGDDAPADPLAADASDDPVLADSDPVGDEESDTDPLAADLDAVTRGTPAADEETVAVADDEVVSDVDADTDSADADPLAEDTAADESRSASSASVEGADAPGADEPLVAEAEPDAAEAESDATEADPDADDSPEDDDEEGVYTTSLVEEVESFDDDERDEKKKGFLSRFLG